MFLGVSENELQSSEEENTLTFTPRQTISTYGNGYEKSSERTNFPLCVVTLTIGRATVIRKGSIGLKNKNGA